MGPRNHVSGGSWIPQGKGQFGEEHLLADCKVWGIFGMQSIFSTVLFGSWQVATVMWLFAVGIVEACLALSSFHCSVCCIGCGRNYGTPADQGTQ